ncbi:MAG: hypothetical protein AB8C13_04275 [Phycisphaerales bacterium]
MMGGIMSKQRLIDTVIQLYLAERQAVAALYTQAGILLTVLIAIVAALSTVATPERLGSSEVSFARDVLLVLSLFTLSSVVVSVFYIVKGVLPRTSYPKNRVNDVVKRLKNGESTEERVENALGALERLFSEASEIYQDENELRALKLKHAFKYPIVAAAFLASTWISVLLTQIYGA